jgi:hypothetical protein
MWATSTPKDLGQETAISVAGVIGFALGYLIRRR